MDLGWGLNDHQERRKSEPRLVAQQGREAKARAVWGRQMVRSIVPHRSVKHYLS